ncbi:MAG: hypothetical protein H6642_12650 [Caldilineaceae bacterium]|nr:hypothetical protein [Caldilineaceae bacterium]
MAQFFDSLHFFASGSGLLTLGGCAALMILFWDWRVALAGLLCVQSGLLALGVTLYDLPVHWAGLQLTVMTLTLLMLIITALQVQRPRARRQAGNWLVRLLAIVLFVLAWRVLGEGPPLPEFGSSVTALLLWLAFCTLLLLGLSDSPLFTAVALLLWMSMAQLIVAVLTPAPNLFVLIAGAELLISLAGSRLMLLDQEPLHARDLIATDIVFPYEEDMYADDDFGADDERAIDAGLPPLLIQDAIAALEGERPRVAPSPPPRNGHGVPADAPTDQRERMRG